MGYFHPCLGESQHGLTYHVQYLARHVLIERGSVRETEREKTKGERVKELKKEYEKQ